MCSAPGVTETGPGRAVASGNLRLTRVSSPSEEEAPGGKEDSPFISISAFKDLAE